jgi:hypothetical protein
MKERRQFERFDLTLPVQLKIINHDKKKVFNLKTMDISSSGVFIDTTEQFSNGTRFEMNFTITSEKIKSLTGALSLIECEGGIVRSTPTGMAIRFDTECQILCLKGL